jgi:hypothetical protein
VGCNAILGNTERTVADGNTADAALEPDGAPSPGSGAGDGGAPDEASGPSGDAGIRDADSPDVFDAGACPGSAACPRTVFVTSAVHAGDFGGVAAATAICQSLADASAQPAVKGHAFVAWLDDGVSTVIDRLVHGTAPYRTVAGDTIATSWEDLVDGSHLVPIDRDESNAPATGIVAVWTGANTTGTASSSLCGGWASTTGNGQQGLSNATNGTWTDNSYHPCSDTARFYCFER